MKIKTVQPKLRESLLLPPALLATIAACVLPSQALTVTCPANYTIECGSPLTFNMPSVSNACSTNIIITPLTNIVSGSGCNSTHTQIWQVSDGCTNKTCSQTITVADHTPPMITCASNKTVPCGSGTFDPPTAVDACCGTNVTITVLGTVTSPLTPFVSTRTWLISDCCGNTTNCSQTVTVTNCNPPRLDTYRTSSTFNIDRHKFTWVDTAGAFRLQTIPGLGLGFGSGGGSGWTPMGGLPSASWMQLNQTNNQFDRFVSVDLPFPLPLLGTNAHPFPQDLFFRLATDASIGKDFSSATIGSYTNPWPLGGVPPVTFSTLGTQPPVISDFNGTHALQVDVAGIAAVWPTNDPPTFSPPYISPPIIHEVALSVVGSSNGPVCLYAKAFDIAGQLVDAAMMTNVSPPSIEVPPAILRSLGSPLQRVEVVAEPGEIGGLVFLKGRTDYTLAINETKECLDFTTYPTGMVSNPWLLPGYTLTSTNSSNSLGNAFIEAGLDGYSNGYHVEYSASIQLTTNCCRHILLELITHSTSAVQVSAYDESGTELTPHFVTTSGTPVIVDFPPSSGPVCKLVVTSPDDQTRILRICCLPVVPIPPLCWWCQVGTNSNPLVAGTPPRTVKFEVLGSIYTFIFPHNTYTNHAVLDLANETLATLETPCNKVLLEVISENSTGMELEAANEDGVVVSRAGPLNQYSGAQTVLLTGPNIKTVRFKSPNGQGYLAGFHTLTQ